MGLSVNKFTYSGTDEFDLNFALGYASRNDVTAYKSGDPNVDIDFDWLTDERVRLQAGHDLSNGDLVVFRRTVSKQTLPVDLTQPGEATRENLEEVARHTMRAVHEILDDRVADTTPWEIIGGLGSVEIVLNYDYLSVYTTNRDGE